MHSVCGWSEVTYFFFSPYGMRSPGTGETGKRLLIEAGCFTRGPLANHWCHSLSFSIHKIGILLIMKLKTFCPILIRLCKKSWACWFHLGVGFTLQLGWGFTSLECEPFIYDKHGGCFEGESLYSSLSLWKSREGRLWRLKYLSLSC